MTPREVIERAVAETAVDEDGQPLPFELLPPASDEEIAELERRGPIPDEVRDLLAFAKGLEPAGLVDTLSFLGLGEHEAELFPGAVDLCPDGYGNFWFVEVTERGWGPVFFACHDPPVFALQAPDLTRFLEQLVDECQGRAEKKGALTRVHDGWVFDVWRKEPYLLDAAGAGAAGDEALAAFARTLPRGYSVCDLRTFEEGRGFSWGRSDKPVLRHEGGERIFAVPSMAPRGGVLSRLFGRRS